MANIFLYDLKQCLDNCISELDSIRHLFCKDPGGVTLSATKRQHFVKHVIS